MRWFKVLSLAAAVATFTVGSVKAQSNLILKQPGPASRPAQLDVMAGLSPWELGVAAWYGIPVLPEGFIKPWNDSLYIEFGGAFEYYWGYFYDFAALSPAAGARYNWYLTREWTVFVTAKLGWRIDFSDYDYGGFLMFSSAGAYYDLGDMSLRLEVGYPFLAQAGLSFEF